jgi:hypothetical protein
MEELGLKDLLRQTRLEIESAAREREAAGEEGLFQVDSVTIEAHFIVRRNAGIDGSFKLLAVTLDGSGKYEKEQVQKVTVVLSPVQAGKPAASVQPFFVDVNDPGSWPDPKPSGKAGRPVPFDLLMQSPYQLPSGTRLWVTPKLPIPGGSVDLGQIPGLDSDPED